MNRVYTVQPTRRFARELRALTAAHPQLANLYERTLAILARDPHNQTRRHPVRKLENVAPGGGQYRLRLRRFRFRYDITGPTVTLTAVSLRREDTYR